MSGDDDRWVADVVASAGGSEPDPDAAYAAVLGRVRVARRRRVAVVTAGGAAGIALVFAAVALRPSSGEDGGPASAPISTSPATTAPGPFDSTTSAPPRTASSTSVAASTPTTDATAGTAPASTAATDTAPGITRTFSCAGGSARVLAQGDSLTLLSTSAVAGFTEVERQVDADSLRLEWESTAMRSRLDVDARDGAPVGTCQDQPDDGP